MSDEAERRKANRMRVAAAVDGENPPPGFTGAEVVALRKLAPHKPGRGDTQLEGGWHHPKGRLHFNKGDER
jgi:hypothetical protein